MPTYELSCEDCGGIFEKFLTRLLRDDDRICPECGSRRVKQGVGGGYGAAITGGSGGCAPSGRFG